MPNGLQEVASFLPLIMVGAIFYFLVIRPQQKKMKEHADLLAAIRRGDKIVTSGGIIGMVTKITSDTELQVEIAENVKVRVLRAMVSQVLAKTGTEEPAAIVAK